MVVTVFAVLAMDVAAHDVVDVSGVRNRDVLATDAVHVFRVVSVARMPRVARHEVGGAEFVLVHVAAVRVVQVTVVHVVHVVVVADGEMSAALAVHVLVVVVNVGFHLDLRSRNGRLPCADRAPLLSA